MKMSKQYHYEALENMYRSAPVNEKIYPSATIEISEGLAEIIQRVDPNFFHAGGGLHGSVYFKLLDDAAYFSAAASEDQFFLVTKSFEIKFLRPVKEGVLEATGRFISRREDLFEAQATLSANGKVVGRGSGLFALTTLKLSDIEKYSTSKPER